MRSERAAASWVIEFCARNRFLVIVRAAAPVALAVVRQRAIAPGATPDVSDTQVTVARAFVGLRPIECSQTRAPT